MTSYREAGVDLDAADAVVDSISAAVTSTWNDNVVGSFGGFAGGFRIPAGYSDPILMMSTDGIGTKLDLARRLGRLDGVGFDLVAMVADDLAAAGAKPLALTDYIAVGRLDPDEVATVVRSIADACRAAGIALIGGETAEHPGTLPPESLDVAAAAVGVVNADEIFDPDAIEIGDIIVGVESPNLRSNGFSLVRALIDDPAAPIEIAGRPLSELLTEPSVVYTPAAVEARRFARGYVHVTGGGLVGNIPRVLRDGLGARIDESAWPVPPIFSHLAALGPVPADEMRRVFNMGIGFVAICRDETVAELRDVFSVHGHTSHVIGSITAGSGVEYESSTRA